MSLLSLIVAGLFYLSVLIFIVGIIYKLSIYLRTPVPLKIPIPPAPKTRMGVCLRLLKEGLLFSTLFRANKWTWLFGWLFHVGLLLELVCHLRFIYGASAPSILYHPFWAYGVWLITVGAGGLLIRRIAVDRVRYISAPSDYLWLAVFLISALSGALMSWQIVPVNIAEVMRFISALLRFDTGALQMPDHLIFMLHFVLAMGVLIAYPASKLMHAPGILLSPTLNQTDDAREKRHTS